MTKISVSRIVKKLGLTKKAQETPVFSTIQTRSRPTFLATQDSSRLQNARLPHPGCYITLINYILKPRQLFFFILAG
jgi:hypothetical protein